MHSMGRNNLIGYCLPHNSKQEVRISHLFHTTPTVITSSHVTLPDQSVDSIVNMAIADSQGNSISVNCYNLGEFAIAMDGLLADQDKIYQKILASNLVLLSKSSEELVAYLLAQEATSERSFPKIIHNFLSKYVGGYSLIVMNKERIYAARDCYGIKPLVIGRIEDPGDVLAYDLESTHLQVTNKTPNVITSNSVMLENIGAKYIRQVLPGEIVELSSSGVKSVGICYRKCGDESTMCAMEYIIMEPPSSFLEEQRVQNVRFRLGQAMAADNAVESDCVVTLPNVSTAFVLGYAQTSGIHFMEAFYYASSATDSRQLSLYNENVADRVITVVIDSTLNQDLVAALYLLKNSAAKKVHLKVCSPLIVSPCPFGIDVTVHCSNLRDVTTIAYLKVDSLSRTIRDKIPESEVKNVGHCFNCFGRGHFLQRF